MTDCEPSGSESETDEGKDFLPTSSTVPTVKDTQIPKNRFRDLGGLKFSPIIC